MNSTLQPITVSILSYNSSKFILETLKSIKSQTYPNIILHICDDCSPDNTVEICKQWLVENESRFVSTEIIVPEHNTGVTANCNRAWDACTTTYHKEIAGDDILLPNCIEDNMKYVEEHPEAVLVFSKIQAFGVNEERSRYFAEEVFIYDFFNWTPEKQYDFLRNERNCIPASTCFENITEIRKAGLRHDERIPLQEDHAKWLNALKLGIKLEFFDTVTIKYRLHENSLSTSTQLASKYLESCELFHVYYHFDNVHDGILNNIHQLLQTKQDYANLEQEFKKCQEECKALADCFQSMRGVNQSLHHYHESLDVIRAEIGNQNRRNEMQSQEIENLQLTKLHLLKKKKKYRTLTFIALALLLLHFIFDIINIII